MLSMLPLRLVVVPVSCSCLQKFVHSPQFPTFIWKFLNKFFLFHNLWKHTNFPLRFDLRCRNSCLHQTIDTKPSSATKQRAFSIRIINQRSGSIVYHVNLITLMIHRLNKTTSVTQKLRNVTVELLHYGIERKISVILWYTGKLAMHDE